MQEYFLRSMEVNKDSKRKLVYSPVKHSKTYLRNLYKDYALYTR